MSLFLNNHSTPIFCGFIMKMEFLSEKENTGHNTL